MGMKRLLATAVSCLVAVALLALAAWMIFGAGSSTPGDAAVQILPPGNADGDGNPDAVPADPPAEQPAENGSGSDEIAVYVTGEVINPGVYTVAAGQRLDAVLTLAGGPTENADLNRVNLAAYVTDAAHYKIPAVAEGDSGDGQSASGETGEARVAVVDGGCAPPININTATAHCLETLPGIGRVRAESIVAHREQAGPFASAEGITAVSGIGDGIYQRIAPLITVNSR